MKIHRQAAESSIPGKLLALATGVILLAAGLLFSVLVLPVIAGVALAVWAYFLWKTRKFRQAMREQSSYGQVIDGEAIVVDEFTEEKEKGQGDLPRVPPLR